MQEPVTPRTPLMRRPTTRRALLAGAATVAAGGTAAAVVGLTTRTSADSSNGSSLVVPGLAADATKSAADELKKPIEDPKVRAAHLLRRAGWGGSAAQIAEFAALDRETAADRLLNFESVDNAALDAKIAAANFNLTTPGRGLDGKRPPLIRDMSRWWLYRMSYSQKPLEERMTFIWHGLLTTQQSQIGFQRSKQMITQNELFRAHALGQYDVLLKAVSKDPAMMTYLNTVDSTKEHPNENYARELMELYSMGEGNYTENDVRESARAFTGWRLTPPTKVQPPAGLSEKERDEYLDQLWGAYEPAFVLNTKLHDSGSKTFLGQTGNWGGDDIVDIIMKQPATARFITKRLFSEFAYRDPDPATIDRLVEVWNSSNHNVKAVVRAILTSDEFYSRRAYRALVRSPLEFMVGAVRGLEVETDWLTVEQSAAGMDQRLYEPPSVAGWPGGEVWLSSGTFFGRVNFLDATLFPKNKAVAIPSLSSQATAEATVDEALRRLVDDDIAPEARQSIYAYARTITNPQERAAAVAYLVLASPEYQLI
ncbi:MAG: DUF1800 domain-containing protein [Dehalococcoidia bacterium]|uniref:DUF1800 domain-containing protein n=1 Tax=Candidatus Amarobacter glycogenicus TaxID=3140699 RepID=UPI0031356164|nr:DUF1800 domain-containing protein [Dehalococcoidia bacterium]MBK6560429.1 DUF1800 domain-containing protein [Dehalococcoidia bacterium]MBK7125135.1 DUF1800 domain-containing protein [Dehalococcoidia bacterium]MBK9342671.1 DUF1800 domain-containing protein [Dehalococcoidia bacterium]